MQTMDREKDMGMQTVFLSRSEGEKMSDLLVKKTVQDHLWSKCMTLSIQMQHSKSKGLRAQYAAYAEVWTDIKDGKLDPICNKCNGDKVLVFSTDPYGSDDCECAIDWQAEFYEMRERLQTKIEKYEEALQDIAFGRVEGDYADMRYRARVELE